MYRTLNADKLVDTGEKLSQRIEERFPSAGLGEVAREICATLRDSAARAEKIAQPNIPLRIGLVLLVVLLIAGMVALIQLDAGEQLGRIWRAMAATQGAAVSLAVVFFFFWTLETRFKRRKALKAIHEVRTLIQVIDMHQLAKNPEQVSEGGSVEIGGRPMDGTAMTFYLEFCTELLSLVSKIGHLFVQDFPDSVSLNAADQIETLATGMSNKIWQKIMILQSIRAEQEAASGPLPQKG